MTAKVVFSTLYIGAVAPLEVAEAVGEGDEGKDGSADPGAFTDAPSSRWMAPRHLYRMRDSLAAQSDIPTRIGFYRQVPRSSDESWYADNSREGGRDEGVRQGLIPLNAMVKRTDVSTTSMEGRYALHPDFAALLDPRLKEDALAEAIQKWREVYLTTSALMRAALAGQVEGKTVTVTHPQGGSTVLPFGESPEITKAVVEEFGKRFLKQPAVVWISDSAKKIFSDDLLNKTLKISLDVATLLPDIIMVDMARPNVKFVFVEVVSSDGPVTEQRKGQLLELLANSPAGWKPEDAMFVTAYKDRQSRPVAKSLRELAWGTFAWFMSEPDHLVQLHAGPPRKLSSLL